jgi:hypothetical protein
MNGTIPDTLYSLAPPLVALQFAAFGWRVNREIDLADSSKATWIPVPDVLNILSLLATVICVIVVPIATGSYFLLSRIVLGMGYVLIAFHPFTVAAHYRLWTRAGRNSYATRGKDYPYATSEELASTSFSIMLAILAAAYIGMH